MSEAVDKILFEKDRALYEKAKLKVGAIGVGFAGSYNAQKLYEALGIPVYVINSSARDLSESVINKEIPSFLIGDEGRGAGNDRQKSKQLFKVNGRDLLTCQADFLKLINDNDILFIVFSSAGGTGSGTGPELVNLCRKMFPVKTIIPIVIAPRKFDSSLSQYNNLACINEIDALEGPYIIGDLERFAHLNESDAYVKMSEWVLETVRKISGMDFELSNAGMMDENDLSNLINASGYLAQYTINVSSKELEKHDIQSLLIEEISKSPAMVIQKDKHIAWGGLVVNIPNDIVDPITTGDTTTLVGTFGEPRHFYKNFSVSKNAKGTVTLIVSGMSIPKNRLDESYEKVQNYLEASAKSQRNISLATDMAQLSQFAADFGGFSKKAESKSEDVLGDYFG